MDIATKTEGMINEVADLGKRVAALRSQCTGQCTGHVLGLTPHSQGEVLANLSLAVRHLEDAQSRVERAWCLMGTDQPVHQS